MQNVYSHQNYLEITIHSRFNILNFCLDLASNNYHNFWNTANSKGFFKAAEVNWNQKQKNSLIDVAPSWRRPSRTRGHDLHFFWGGMGEGRPDSASSSSDQRLTSWWTSFWKVAPKMQQAAPDEEQFSKFGNLGSCLDVWTVASGLDSSYKWLWMGGAKISGLVQVYQHFATSAWIICQMQC